MVICDTNILIEIYKGNSLIINNFSYIGQANIAISDVTSGELLFGARNKEELKSIRKDSNSLVNLPINEKISALSIQLIEKYALSQKLSLPDALIASTAILYEYSLYTLNTKDFKFIENLILFEI